MKQLLVFVRKEFYHVFRDRRTLLILFGLPVAQIILFGFALSSEVKNIGIVVFDQSKDINTQHISDRVKQSEYFIVKEPATNYREIQERFRSGEVKCALVFPPRFGEELYRSGKAQIQLIADASDPNNAKIASSYIMALVQDYQQELNPDFEITYQILPQRKLLYNPRENGSLNFVPGVISLIFMIVSTALTSVAVVREKETGTMEILLVSPFRPVMVLVSKAIPYLVLSFVNLILILILSEYLLDVAIQGSVLLILAESLLFIVTCLSLGLMISNVTTTQQSAMLASMMGMMLPTLLLTGFMFPLENMPWIFQVISHVIPSRYYYSIMKSVMLKGLGFSYVWKETLILFCMTAFLLNVSLKKFKIRLS